MSVQALAAKARKHWAEWRPNLTKELKEQGIYSAETQKAAVRAQRLIDSLMRKGYYQHEAEEVALKEYILLEPEEGASGLGAELDAELEEMERQYQEDKPIIFL
jgi:DNA-directed RNA polymerase specialized sigma54-like protein